MDQNDNDDDDDDEDDDDYRDIKLREVSYTVIRRTDDNYLKTERQNSASARKVVIKVKESNM